MTKHAKSHIHRNDFWVIQNNSLVVIKVMDSQNKFCNKEKLKFAP